MICMLCMSVVDPGNCIESYCGTYIKQLPIIIVLEVVLQDPGLLSLGYEPRENDPSNSSDPTLSARMRNHIAACLAF